MKKTYIQPLATKFQLEIESLLLEASDQGDHAESKPQILFEEEATEDYPNWADNDLHLVAYI